MKKLLTFIITIFILFELTTPYNLHAAEVNTETIYMDNGEYIETTIVTYPQTRSSNTKTATKTSTYKNSSNEALWSVSVTATFSYETGKSCLCTSVSGESKSYSSVWKVSGTSTSKSGNAATAKATGTKYFIGIPMNSYNLSVTLTCDTYGNLS